MARLSLRGARMETLLQDVRYTIRALGRTPGFTTAALLTLAIGTGANISVFSFINALLLRPAPTVSDPSSLVSVYTSDFSSGPYGATSYPDYRSMQAEVTALSGLAAYGGSTVVLRDDTVTERVRSMAVSSEFFPLLGLRPAQGRLLDAGDAAAAATPVAVRRISAPAFETPSSQASRSHRGR